MQASNSEYPYSFFLMNFKKRINQNEELGMHRLWIYL